MMLGREMPLGRPDLRPQELQGMPPTDYRGGPYGRQDFGPPPQRRMEPPPEPPVYYNGGVADPFPASSAPVPGGPTGFGGPPSFGPSPTSFDGGPYGGGYGSAGRSAGALPSYGAAPVEPPPPLYDPVPPVSFGREPVIPDIGVVRGPPPFEPLGPPDFPPVREMNGRGGPMGGPPPPMFEPMGPPEYLPPPMRGNRGPLPPRHERAPFPGRGMMPDGKMYGKGFRCFVGGVPDALSDADMKAHFDKYGQVMDVYFPKDRNTGQRRDFCFLTFATAQAADAAVARSPRTINGHDIGEIKRAEERPEAPMIPRGGPFGGGRGRGREFNRFRPY